MRTGPVWSGGTDVASIDKRPDGTYRARWREYANGPQRTRHFERKADAQRFLDGLRGDLARGMYIDPASGRMPFRAYAEEWRAAQMHRTSTASQCETYLRLQPIRPSATARSARSAAARSRRG